MRTILAAIAVLFLGLTAVAEGVPAGVGRHFIIAFPDTLRHISPVEPFDGKAQLVVFAQQRTTVTINGPGISRTLVIDSSHSTTVDIPPSAPAYLDRVDEVVRRTYEVIADGDIIVYAFFWTTFGAEAFTPLPVEQWGDEYFVAGARPSTVFDVNYALNEERPTRKFAPSQFAVIASVTGTRITMTGDVQRSIELDAGEAYLVEPLSATGTPVDPIGTRIVASAPIAVVAGGTRTSGVGGGLYTGTFATGNTFQNVTVEWLAPTSMHGTMFFYDPVMRPNNDIAGELIRIVATSPGATTIRLSTGRIKTIPQGDTLEVATIAGRQSIGPVSIRTDKPAEAVLVAGHYTQSTTHPGNYVEANTWASSLVELTPRERWLSFSRFHTPPAPEGMEHWLIVYGDRSARIWLDGRELALRSFRSGLGEIRFTEVRIDTGDHELRSGGGIVGGIVHGRVRGYEAFKPPIARGGDSDIAHAGRGRDVRSDADDLLLHPSTYQERMAYSYAYPLVGLTMTDSLSLTTEQGCDSAVVVVDHAPGPWSGQSLSYRREPDATNVTVQASPRMSGTLISGYRFRFAPIDRTRSGAMTITIISSSGIVWPITYTYDPEILEISPKPVYFSNASVGVPATASARLINRGNGEVTVRTLRMLDGTQGFSVSADLPAVIAPGESIPVAVTFVGESGPATFRDSIIVETCLRTSAPVVAITREVPRDPMPVIDSVDWRERWLSTLNACTKSTTAAYDSVITIANLGNAAFTVATIELIGTDADSGYFALDMSDPTMRVVTGDTIAPASQSSLPHRQRVLFRPRDERAYRCLVRLETTDGVVAFGELRGVGIESHIVVEPDPVDAGTVGFIGAGATAVRCTAFVRALPTRPLLVQELRIAGADSSEFIFDNVGGFQAPRLGDPSTWWTLAPGEEREVPMLFAPSDTGRAIASLEATGDHSRCDDSTITLLGGAVPPIGIGDVRPIARSACGDTVIQVTLINHSGTPVTLTQLAVAPDDEFSIAPPVAIPTVIAPGDTLAIPVRYAPIRVGISRARVDLDISDAAGTRLIQHVRVSFTTDARGDSLVAHVVPPERMAIGEVSTVRVVLDEPAFAVVPGSLRLAVGWSSGVLRLMNVVTDGTLLRDWTMTIDRLTDDTLEATFTPTGDGVIDRAGILAKIEFLPLLGSQTSTDIRATLTPSVRPCIETWVEPGMAQLDSICGLAQRLIELFPEGVSKLVAAPNPFDASTVAVFGVDVPTHVRLEVIDALGRIVAVLADGDLDAGTHMRAWAPDAGGAGLYHLRLTAGENVTTAPMWRVR